ncbi:uncharacterized protein LOC121378217 [Gigantopelta aegis]|uniref:uncharacterized protein LOC121378217 n=1 Tax=Gigantopelta aegis TaxID=1735272 RepID=UPI001B88BEEC|nr:uncharacterized protein LOC121378217 [Gigantopelta aegis]
MAESKNKKASSCPLQTKLDKILRNQKQIFEELISIKRQLKISAQCTRMIKQSTDRQLSEVQEKTTKNVRNVEMTVLGLTAVLDHVQERLVQLELTQYDSSKGPSSTSSLSSTDEEADFLKTGERKLDCTRPEQTCNHNGGQLHSNQKWLRENHLLLVKGIDTTGCLLLDYLVQEHILSDTDEDDISSHRTRKDKTRELLFKMRHADNKKICQFVKHLQKDFPHLVRSFSNDSETGERNSCVACDVVQQVNVDDAIDVLLQEAVVDDDLYEKIWRCTTKKKGWSRLLKNMHHTRMPKCLSVLAQALAQKYPQLCKRITESGIETLECCYKRKTSSSSICCEVRDGTTIRKMSTGLKSRNGIPIFGNKKFTQLYQKYRMKKPPQKWLV